MVQRYDFDAVDVLMLRNDADGDYVEYLDYESLKQQRGDLLEALKRDAFLANQAILATPTGDLRNKLTEINILRLAAIANCEA